MIHPSIERAIIATVLGLWTVAASAENTVVSLAEQPNWNAVGRVNKSGYNRLQSCSATLIASDLILTAGHCVPRDDPSAERLAEFIFVAGWNRGEYAAASAFAEIYLHPEDDGAPISGLNIHTDIALVRLANPIAPELVTPMPMAQHEAMPVRIDFAGYPKQRRHALELGTDCVQSPATAPMIRFECPVFSGQSGGPIMIASKDGPRLIGVISARVGQSALGVALQDWMGAYVDLP